MPRTARASAGNVCYHVLNRGNAQNEVFHKPEDYAAFLKLLKQANERLPMRIIAYCLMPNHFHLVLWPRNDGDLSSWMQWLMTLHVRRYQRHYQSSGHVWQGRFKAFPIQQDEHLLTVIRYVERNPVRAKTIPIRKAERWPWQGRGRVSFLNTSNALKRSKQRLPQVTTPEPQRKETRPRFRPQTIQRRTAYGDQERGEKKDHPRLGCRE